MRHWGAAAVATALACFAAAVLAQGPRTSLSVKPVLCITDARHDSCALTVLVSWRSDSAGSYCLHNTLSAEPLECWQFAESGMVMEERVVRETLSYWLTDGSSQQRLAEASLDVMSTEVHDRRRHRSRRHVWDIL